MTCKYTHENITAIKLINIFNHAPKFPPASLKSPSLSLSDPTLCPPNLSPSFLFLQASLHFIEFYINDNRQCTLTSHLASFTPYNYFNIHPVGTYVNNMFLFIGGYYSNVWASLPAMQETWVRSLGQEDPLEEGMATHSSILAWEIPRTEEPVRLQSIVSQSQTQLEQLSRHTSIPLYGYVTISLSIQLWMNIWAISILEGYYK